MQNQLNSQFLPYQYNAQQPSNYGTSPIQPVQYQQVQGYPQPSVGAVNIQIFNPTANPQQGFYQPVQCAPYPYNYNNMMVQNQNSQPVNNAQQNASTPELNQGQALNMNYNNNNVAGQGNGSEGTKTESKKEKDKPKVALTDDYIKTLENYLNSQDKKVRLMGAKELFERFKEDETRKDDAALTALLNKVLQDPAETVKFIALTAINSGYANGNNETVQLLQQIQNSNTTYGEDAALATSALLKMSGNQANDQQAILNNQNQTAETSQASIPSAADLNQNGMQMAQMPPENGGVLLNPDAQNVVQNPVNNGGVA